MQIKCPEIVDKDKQNQEPCHMQGGTLTLTLQGRLDFGHSRELWEWSIERLREPGVQYVVCDLQDVTFMDTAGIALLRDLEDRCVSLGIRLRFDNLPHTALPFLEGKSHAGQGEPHDREHSRPGRIVKLGIWFEHRLSSMYSLISFVGRCVAASLDLLKNPREFRFQDALAHMQHVGAEATLLICTINALTGSVVVFQGEGVAETFGAPIYVAHMVARSITAQMSPVLTALLLAGRSGTSFAANIGTMKIRQELDVLAVRNMDIVKMLVLPRVLAIGLVTPLLTMLASASGILGGLLTGVIFLDLSAAAFLNEVQMSLGPRDISMALVKGLVFGVVIGLTGCFHGLRTGNTADSVGFRTTAAVVSSTFFIIVANSVFAALFNTFGW